MLSLGHAFPRFTLTGVVSPEIDKAFCEINSDHAKGQWRVYFFWPKDFTFVCPTEIAEFGRLYSSFKDRDTEVFGVSTDSEFVHLAWKQHKEELQRLQE